jgi:hypothetical protein
VALGCRAGLHTCRTLLSRQNKELYWYSDISNKCSSVSTRVKKSSKRLQTSLGSFSAGGTSGVSARTSPPPLVDPALLWCWCCCLLTRRSCNRNFSAIRHTRKQECELLSLLMVAPRETLRRCTPTKIKYTAPAAPRHAERERDEIIKAFISGMRDTHGQPASAHHQSTNRRLSNFGLSI